MLEGWGDWDGGASSIPIGSIGAGMIVSNWSSLSSSSKLRISSISPEMSTSSKEVLATGAGSGAWVSFR